MLLLRLRRKGLDKPGALATYILDGVQYNNVYYAPVAFKKGLCEEGKWKVWMQKLCDEGFLVNETSENNWNRFTPGRELYKVLNHSKACTEDLVTLNQVKHMFSKRDAMLQRICISTGIPYDPPDFEEFDRVMFERESPVTKRNVPFDPPNFEELAKKLKETTPAETPQEQYDF